MSRHLILFGFVRGSAGEEIEVSPTDAGLLMDAGLIGPALKETAEARETKPALPESKEATDAADPVRPGSKRGNAKDS